MIDRFLRGREMRRALPAGVFDAALASLATFFTGLVAVNLLGDVDRGVYAVFFTAFGLGTVAPNQLAYGPTQILAVDAPMGERLAFLGRSLRIGSSMSALAMLSVLPAIAVTAHIADAELTLALAVTCAATIFLSPTQDHLRRMLHIDGASWSAAFVSAVQLATAVIAIAVLVAVDVPVAWVPFGGLATANLCSLLVGLLIAYRRVRGRSPRPIPLRRVWELGSWLFVQSLVPGLTAFAVAAIITVLAGPEAIGYAEAARIVAQPVLVLGTGLTAVLSPRVMEAAITRHAERARRFLRGYVALVAGTAALYALFVAVPWVLNPMSRLVPAAYSVSGLVAITIAVDVLVATAFLVGHELAAARRQKATAFVALAVAPLRLAGAASAGVTGAFARPIAQGLGISTSLVAYSRLRSVVYRSGSSQSGERTGSKDLDREAGSLP